MSLKLGRAAEARLEYAAILDGRAADLSANAEAIVRRKLDEAAAAAEKAEADAAAAEARGARRRRLACAARGRGGGAGARRRRRRSARQYPRRSRS